MSTSIKTRIGKLEVEAGLINTICLCGKSYAELVRSTVDFTPCRKCQPKHDLWVGFAADAETEVNLTD